MFIKSIVPAAPIYSIPSILFAGVVYQYDSVKKEIIFEPAQALAAFGIVYGVDRLYIDAYCFSADSIRDDCAFPSNWKGHKSNFVMRCLFLEEEIRRLLLACEEAGHIKLFWTKDKKICGVKINEIIFKAKSSLVKGFIYVKNMRTEGINIFPTALLNREFGSEILEFAMPGEGGAQPRTRINNGTWISLGKDSLFNNSERGVLESTNQCQEDFQKEIDRVEKMWLKELQRLESYGFLEIEWDEDGFPSL